MVKLLLIVMMFQKDNLFFVLEIKNFYFEKDMIKNLFQRIGTVKFIKSNYLQNDIISIVSKKKKKKYNLKKKISDQNLKILNQKIKKLIKIKNLEKNIEIFHYNFQSKIISYFLSHNKSKIVTNRKKKFKEKNIIDIKNSFHSNFPIVISKSKENEKIIYNFKQRNKKIYLI